MNVRLQTLRCGFALLFCCACLPLQGHAATIRLTTWNLEWFPNGTPKEAPAEKQTARIAAAANVLRPLNPDIVLLQEVKDYDACVALAEAVSPRTYQVAVCSAFKERGQIGKQQVAILAKEPAQAAWSEPWKSMEGVDPPRGFAFGWFKIHGADIGVYSVHLKSNLVMHGDKEAEAAKNVRKREVAAHQLLNHIRDVIAIAMPNVGSLIVGGDFNTDIDEFANEATLRTFETAGFLNCMAKLPIAQRVTHPGGHGYPDATFDYLFARNAAIGMPAITPSNASDHLPVTVEITIGSSAPSAVAHRPAGAGLQQQFVTVRQSVPIEIPYGKTVIPAGSKLPLISRSGSSVTVRYLDSTYVIPASATDL